MKHRYGVITRAPQIVVFILSLSLSIAASADAFDDAFDYYQAGNYQAAFAGFKPLADQGVAMAQWRLGFMYDQGLGGPQDYKQAVAWFNLAAVSGHEDAIKNRDLVAKEMNSAQLAEAQKPAREWKPTD